LTLSISRWRRVSHLRHSAALLTERTAEFEKVGLCATLLEKDDIEGRLWLVQRGRIRKYQEPEQD